MKHISKITESFYEFSNDDLKLLRRRMYKTQQEMADLLGFKDRASICFYEKEHNKMSKQKALLCNLMKNYMEMNNDS